MKLVILNVAVRFFETQCIMKTSKQSIWTALFKG